MAVLLGVVGGGFVGIVGAFLEVGRLVGRLPASAVAQPSVFASDHLEGDVVACGLPQWAPSLL